VFYYLAISLKLKPLTVLSPDIIENIKKDKKLLPIVLPVFLLGLEGLHTELN